MLRSVKASVAAVKTAMASAPADFRPFEAAQVWNEDGIPHAIDPRQRPEQFVGVGELGDGPRPDEAGGLDLAEPGRGEAGQELQLGRDRDRLGLVLEPVARPDLVDPDPLAHRGGSAQTSGGVIARSVRAISISRVAISSAASR